MTYSELYLNIMVSIIAGALCVLAYLTLERREIIVSDSCGRSEGDACHVRTHQRKNEPALRVELASDAFVWIKGTPAVKIEDRPAIAVRVMP